VESWGRLGPPPAKCRGTSVAQSLGKTANYCGGQLEQRIPVQEWPLEAETADRKQRGLRRGKSRRSAIGHWLTWAFCGRPGRSGLVVDSWCVDSGSGGEAREGATAAAGWSCFGRAARGGLMGAGQEVALSVSVSCFHCRDQQAVPWCTLGGEWLRGSPPRCGHRSGEPGLVLGCSLWKAGRRSVESNGVQGQGQGSGLGK
jgi:hypothetical protein